MSEAPSRFFSIRSELLPIVEIEAAVFLRPPLGVEPRGGDLISFETDDPRPNQPNGPVVFLCVCVNGAGGGCVPLGDFTGAEPQGIDGREAENPKREGGGLAEAEFEVGAVGSAGSAGAVSELLSAGRGGDPMLGAALLAESGMLSRDVPDKRCAVNSGELLASFCADVPSSAPLTIFSLRIPLAVSSTVAGLTDESGRFGVKVESMDGVLPVRDLVLSGDRLRGSTVLGSGASSNVS